MDGIWEAFQQSQKGGDVKSVTPKVEALDKVIQGLGGSFFGQQIVDVTDLILGPRLHHIEVILKKQGVRAPSLTPKHSACAVWCWCCTPGDTPRTLPERRQTGHSSTNARTLRCACLHWHQGTSRAPPPVL